MSAAEKIEVVTMPAAQLREIVRVEVRQAVAEALATRSEAPPSEWLSAEQAAEIVGVSRAWLRRLKDLPRHGSSRAPRYRRSEVEAFVARRR